MLTSTNYAAVSPQNTDRSIWMSASQFGHDVVRGVLATSKWTLVLLCGLVIVLALALGVHGGLRERAARMLPTSVLTWASDQLQERNAVPVLVVQSASAAETPAKPGRNSALEEAQQRHVTQYLARRYRVAEGAMRGLVAVAYDSGAEMGVDPLLVLSVMAVESSMNPFAESSVGAQGLMQVMTRVHTEKFEPLGGHMAALDPVANIKVGTRILQDLIQRGGSVERGLQLYVGAGNMENDGGYGRRVLGEHGRLKLAADGKVELALLYGLRAVQPETKPGAAPMPVAAPIRPQSKPSESPEAKEKADEAA